MTLHPQMTFSIPEETKRVAQAAYPHGNPYMQLCDILGPIYQDATFAELFPQNGRPVEAPWRLALITVMQFAEDLSDRAAADAVRGRIDWKYALGLELTDPGFDATVLCAFRKRLVQGHAESLLLEALLKVCKEHGWLKARGKQRTDATHVLAKIRAINRLICVGEAMRFALNSLAVLAGDWLWSHCEPMWEARYGSRFEEVHLPHDAKERLLVAETMGADGAALLAAIWAPEAPHFLREVPAVQILQRIWLQNYVAVEGELHWRTTEGIPPATLFISSPYDSQARLSRKGIGGTQWIGDIGSSDGDL